MYRRDLAALAASGLAASVLGGTAMADDGDEGGWAGNLNAACARFLALPGTKSFLVQAGVAGSAGRIAHRSDLTMVIVSAYKTFVLGQYLLDVETERLFEDEQVPIDDTVRDFGRPVFNDLEGTTTATSVLEAMITHSDNTATNAATLKVGAGRVRALIARVGLRSTLIPTLRAFSSPISLARRRGWIWAGRGFSSSSRTRKVRSVRC